MMKKLVSLAILLISILAFATVSMAAQKMIVPSKQYPKLQHAIKAAKDGAVITIKAGTYSGANSLGAAIISKKIKGLVIQGSVNNKTGARLTTLAAGAKNNKIAGGKLSTVFYLYNLDKLYPTAGAATKVTIRNLNIQNVHLPIYSDLSSNVIVSNVQMVKPVQGITVWGGSKWLIQQNYIDGLQTNYTAGAGGGIGIFLGVRAANTHSDNNTIIKNAIGMGKIIQVGAGGGGAEHGVAGIELYADYSKGILRGATVKGNVIGSKTGAVLAKNTIALRKLYRSNIRLHGVGLNENTERRLKTHAITWNTVKGNSIMVKDTKNVPLTMVEYFPRQVGQLKVCHNLIQTLLAAAEFDITDSMVSDEINEGVEVLPY